MTSSIHQENINGFLLNKQNTWTYTPTDLEHYNQYKQYKQMKKEEKEAREKLNVIYNNPTPAGQYLQQVPVQVHVQVPVQVQQCFIGTDMYGFSHYSTINSSGIIIYYYIDKSGLYHYYN